LSATAYSSMSCTCPTDFHTLSLHDALPIYREVEVLLRREMARVRAPGLPLLARGAATGQQERGSDHERTPVLPVHGQILLRKSDCGSSYRRLRSRSIGRSC